MIKIDAKFFNIKVIKIFKFQTRTVENNLNKYNNTVHLFNLPFECNADDLYKIASDFG